MDVLERFGAGAVAQDGIGRVDRSRVVADADLAGASVLLGQIDDVEYFGAAEFDYANSLHIASSTSVAAAWRRASCRVLYQWR
ncbi:MAG: hypothetical protein U5Q44_03925 [Dehalococcoidia bacterium]|nr:hypothetical protein [Dehalococcoidia bacterium]